ncbi:hypothetical protein ACFRAM_28525 [Paenibacillus sp. NPDC056722]|uniref:hypothetical protein n=1 Tax=Paenibacillus sp. NPDC056722 TaxID=3345924 RepID=UPI003684003A
MEKQYVDSLRSIQTKLVNAAEITSEDIQAAREIVRLYPSMVHRALFGMVSGRHQVLLQPNPEQEVERPTAEQLEAARKAAAANPTPQTISAYATLKRQAGE